MNQRRGRRIIAIGAACATSAAPAGAGVEWGLKSPTYGDCVSAVTTGLSDPFFAARRGSATRPSTPSRAAFGAAVVTA